MTLAPIHPASSLLDIFDPEYRGKMTLRNSAAMIDIANQARVENDARAAEQARATEQLGRAVGAGMARLVDAQVAAAGFVAASVERLRADVRAATDTLDDIQREIERTRQLQEDQLAVQEEALDLQRRSLALQQGMLQSDHLQGRVEEFLYQFRKAVERYGVDSPEYPATTRLLILRGFLGEIREQNIATPMIRGIANKGLFDDTVSHAQRLVKELTAHPDVLAAVEWARREQQRVKDEEDRKRREQDAEDQRRREAEEERRYGRWFVKRFGFDHNILMAVLVLLSLGSCCGAPASLLVFGGGPNFSGKTDPEVQGKKVKLGDKLFGMLCFCGVPGPLAVLGVVYLISVAMHRRAVDVAQDQAELDRTVNAEALTEIARLKENLAPVTENLTEVRKEIERKEVERQTE